MIILSASPFNLEHLHYPHLSIMQLNIVQQVIILVIDLSIPTNEACAKTKAVNEMGAWNMRQKC